MLADSLSQFPHKTPLAPLLNRTTTFFLSFCINNASFTHPIPLLLLSHLSSFSLLFLLPAFNTFNFRASLFHISFMAGRNRMPRHPAEFHGFRDGPRSMANRGPGPLPVYPVALEEELEIQHRENQRIVAENRHLHDENVNLERDLVAAKDEIQRLDEVILKLRGDNDAKFRNLMERGLKMEADLRAAEPLREEVMRLRAEAQKLNVMRQDLTGQIQSLSQDVARLRSENKQLSAMRSDVDGIRKELSEARRALEYEKNANEEQLEQKEVMEKNLMSMVREIEKLRAEQLNLDRRGHGLGGAAGSGYGSGTGSSGYGSGASGSGYGMYNGIAEMRYAGGGPADGYGGAWGPYNKRPRR